MAATRCRPLASSNTIGDVPQSASALIASMDAGMGQTLLMASVVPSMAIIASEWFRLLRLAVGSRVPVVM